MLGHLAKITVFCLFYEYADFACRMFKERDKEVDISVVERVYNMCEGCTGFMTTSLRNG